MPAHVPKRVRIWDLPTRLFHWCLAALVTAAWASGQFGGPPWLDWHFRLGYGVLALLVFRLLWGFAGDRYALFSSFAPSWRAALSYLRSQRPSAGHNPLGAFSVYSLLIVLGLQVVTGLFASDGDFSEGPWAHFLSDPTIRLMSRLHRISQWFLLSLVALHLSAIAWHRIARRETLVRAMLWGDKEGMDAEADAEPAADDLAIRLRAVVLFALSAALVAYSVML